MNFKVSYNCNVIQRGVRFDTCKKVKSFIISRKTINQKITVLNKLNIFYVLCLRLVFACVQGHVLCYRLGEYSNLFLRFILKMLSSPYSISTPIFANQFYYLRTTYLKFVFEQLLFIFLYV